MQYMFEGNSPSQFQTPASKNVINEIVHATGPQFTFIICKQKSDYKIPHETVHVQAPVFLHNFITGKQKFDFKKSSRNQKNTKLKKKRASASPVRAERASRNFWDLDWDPIEVGKYGSDFVWDLVLGISGGDVVLGISNGDSGFGDVVLGDLQWERDSGISNGDVVLGSGTGI
jgi:hypothetical protein